MFAEIAKVALAKGDSLNGLEKPRRLGPTEGFSIGPSIYADVVLTTDGGTRRAVGGRRCCAFYLDADGELWGHHGGKLSHLALNGEAWTHGSKLLAQGDRIEIRTAAGDVSLTVEVTALQP